MSPISRALAFGRRFLPFWMAWLVIVALPASREPLKLHLIGSPFTPDSNPPWRDEFLPTERSFDAFAAVARNRGDVNARVWRFSQMRAGKAAGFDKFGEQNTKIYRAKDLLDEAQAIERDFPRHKWLNVLPVRAAVLPLLGMRANLGKNNSMETTDARQLLALLQKAANVEPDNAFYPFLEAEILVRSGQETAMWTALDRASRCKIFDPHDLEWAQAIVRAHDAARPLLLEEKEALWRENLNSSWNAPNWNVPDQRGSFLAHKARLAQGAGDHRRAVQIGVWLGSIGDLMQRGSNTSATAMRGQEWQGQMKSLVFKRTPSPNRRAKLTTWARDFAAYAALHGRPDVAALSQKWQARGRQISAMSIYSPAWGGMTIKPQKDALQRASFYRVAGVSVGVHLVFVAVFWMLVNLILWRGVGAASSSRDRILPALTLALLALVLALWSQQQFEILESVGWSRTREKYSMAVGSVAMLAFFGAPFLLAVWSAAATLWRHKSEFLKPARIETELRLGARDVTLLKSGPTIFCAVSLLATLGFWLLFLILVALDVSNLDLLAWLPDNGNAANWSLSMPVEALLVAVVYCLFLNFLGFLLWFNKWRYYSGPESRALTQGGLRGWKESLGIYLVIGSALYLGIALVGWPARLAASRELETRMARGELPA